MAGNRQMLSGWALYSILSVYYWVFPGMHNSFSGSVVLSAERAAGLAGSRQGLVAYLHQTLMRTFRAGRMAQDGLIAGFGKSLFIRLEGLQTAEAISQAILYWLYSLLIALPSQTDDFY